MGKTIVYNPWSIVNCIKRRGELIPYWVNTSDNQLIKTLFIQSDDEFKEEFQSLLQGQPIQEIISEQMVFDDLKQNPIAVWSLLLMAGYLKIIDQRYSREGNLCTLDIPNQEVRDLYYQIIQQWLANGKGIRWYHNFLDHLLLGNVAAFEEDLNYIMERTVSVHDTSKDPEAFYHGLMVGVTASLYGNKNYEIKSNRESGYGMYDYLIYSHDMNYPTLLIELKRIKKQDTNDLEKLTQALEKAAQEALDQIDRQHYLAEVQHRGRRNILKMGLAFCGKHFKIKAEHVNPKHEGV